jgi:phosphatidylethanolamine-binding protein (PEBP) family uncharacterized protein
MRRSLVVGNRLVYALFLASLVVILGFALPGCGGGSDGSGDSAASSTSTGKSMIGMIVLRSAAFRPGGAIPERYTCDGAGLSPPLRWRNVPSGTAEFLLLAIDLDGDRRDAVQWAVGGLGPGLREIGSGRLPAGAVVGRNSAGKVSWGGVCGTRGRVHHVAFLFYALNRRLRLKAGFDPATVRSELKNATLARGLTVAAYERR